MTMRRVDRGIRALGIAVVILGVVHVPLPQADYHNIRHHDAPGEICVYHDHLLRWHPSADQDDDVTLLHWHWLLPLIEPGRHRQSTGDEPHGPGSGPSLHAHFGDWVEPDWQGEPVVRPDSRGRLLGHLTPRVSNSNSTYLADLLSCAADQSARFSTRTANEADGVRAARSTLYQRWNC
jgi:hypothetical protein